MNKKDLLNNKKGGLTVDFIFAITLVMGLSAILLSLSLTLTVASLTQYITFASARALMVGHHTTRDQAANAGEQFKRLRTHPLLAPLYAGGWFELQTPNYLPLADSFENADTGYPEVDIAPGDPKLFVGITVRFVARMLDFEIPFYGSTSDFGGDGSGFVTTIGSFLSKEPSGQQCKDFSMGRFKAIQKLNIPNGGADYSMNTFNGNYVWWINDNGC